MATTRSDSEPEVTMNEMKRQRMNEIKPMSFPLKNLHSAKKRQTDGLQFFCVGGVKIVNKTKIL